MNNNAPGLWFITAATGLVVTGNLCATLLSADDVKTEEYPRNYAERFFRRI